MSVDHNPESNLEQEWVRFAVETVLGYVVDNTPADLERWYRDEVGIDPNGPLSRCRFGAVKDLETRVVRARELGAVAYVPTSRAAAETDDQTE